MVLGCGVRGSASGGLEGWAAQPTSRAATKGAEATALRNGHPGFSRKRKMPQHLGLLSLLFVPGSTYESTLFLAKITSVKRYGKMYCPA